MFGFFILNSFEINFDQAFIDLCRNWIALLILSPQGIPFVQVTAIASNKCTRPIDSTTNWTCDDLIPSPQRSIRKLGDQLPHRHVANNDMYGVHGKLATQPILPYILVR